MKHFLGLVLGMVLVFSFQGHAVYAGEYKFGVVDLDRFQEKSKGFQKIKESLQQKAQHLQKKLEDERAGLLKLEEEFRKRSMMLNLDAREDKQRDLDKKRRHFKYLYDEFTQEMKEAEVELKRKVGKELEKVVSEIGKKQGYTMILEKKTLGLIYSDDAIDITDQVIRLYDQKK